VAQGVVFLSELYALILCCLVNEDQVPMAAEEALLGIFNSRGP
jgi:hypothetical protein